MMHCCLHVQRSRVLRSVPTSTCMHKCLFFMQLQPLYTPCNTFPITAAHDQTATILRYFFPHVGPKEISIPQSFSFPKS